MKNIRKLLSCFIAALIFCCSAVFPSFAEKPEISYRISYGKDCVYLALTPSNEKNTIYYTTDGSAPTTASKKYSSKLCAKKAVEVRASEFDKKGEKVCSIKVGLKLKCEPVEITARPDGEKYLVSLHSETKSCLIFYTTDGTSPDRKSKLYEKPFSVKKGTKVCAYAVKDEYTKSAYSEEKIGKKTPRTLDELRYGAEAARVLEIINDYRAGKGLSPLAFDGQLMEISKARAKELTVNYSHTRPSGGDWSEMLYEVGFPFAVAAENIAWTEGSLSTPEVVAASWIESEVHRRNILIPEFDLTGIAFFCSGGKTYWVQHFGKKA